MSGGAAQNICRFIAGLAKRPLVSKPVIIGLNGPQGSGKTTATTAAVAMLGREEQLRGIALSIDDFYLTRAEQVKLAAGHAQNPYLQQRGYPGTHDIRLGSETLTRLKSINAPRESVALPRYDKSLNGGEGDRVAEKAWPVVTAPLHYVILEGWCVGFTPVTETAIQDASLAEVNRMLARYAEWHEFFDAFIQFKARDIRDTVRWRIEAEQNMRAQGRPGMSDERIRAYIEKFLPAYDLYLPGLDRHPPLVSPRLIIDIAHDRSVVNTTFY